MRMTKEPTYYKMIEEINETFGEYLEMGYSLDCYLLSKLHIERDKNNDLQMKINRLEKELNS